MFWIMFIKNLIGKISGHVDNKGTDYDESYTGKYENCNIDDT